ncbi:MAG: class I SAM-dependent rRNA methyltransferase [Flavobacteriales bacterium]|nr:class I SAM-dependent rRNA methyltransferase [Flavobacteriales bacterium]
MAIQDFVVLRKGKEDSIKRYHPWVFSGAIFSKSFEDNSSRWVKVLDAKNQVLGTGYFSDSSIAVRLINFSDETPDAVFWKNKFESALNFRKSIGFYPAENSTSFRLINGEGDGIPGLIVDVYADTVVLQFHHAFLFENKELIINGLTAIQTFSDSRIVVRNTFDKHSETELYRGKDKESVVIKENGIQFLVDPFGGQKTGFFLDQRENRSLLETYPRGKRVLNTFCYTGGFSMYALRGGAEKVVSVDISAYAMEQVDKNLKINGFSSNNHESVCADVIPYMHEAGPDFDIIVLDPPAFAKSLSKRHNAIQAYKRLNVSALKVIKKGGLIFTFSCSQVVNREMFERTVYSAAIEAGRNVRVLHRLTQSPCHPTSIFHNEGEYLKGLVLYID